jgi:hypothetical protein
MTFNDERGFCTVVSFPKSTWKNNKIFNQFPIQVFFSKKTINF